MKKIYKVIRNYDTIHIQAYKAVYQNDLFMVVKTAGNPRPMVVTKTEIYNLEKEEKLHRVLDFIYNRLPAYHDIWCSHNPLNIADTAKQEYFIFAEKKKIEERIKKLQTELSNHDELRRMKENEVARLKEELNNSLKITVGDDDDSKI